MALGGASWALALVLSAPAADPRIPLVELQLERQPAAALERIDEQIARDPEGARRLGLHYLRGHLLLTLERRREALQAFAETMAATPPLSPYSRFRLAVEQERAGHPEVAAGLVATLLGSSPPRSLISPAVRLLHRTLRQGGDCRLLRGLVHQRFHSRDLRRLRLAQAECQLRSGELEKASEQCLDLLEDDRDDDVARQAAEHLAGMAPAMRDTRAELLVGLAFYGHREFDRAVGHLERALAAPSGGSGLSSREVFDGRYAIARSHFWETRFERAADAFARLAADTREPSRRAQVLYQEARSRELQGDWPRAAAGFRACHLSEPSGRYSNSALFSYLRLEWLQGHQEEATRVYDELVAKRRNHTVVRASLFLASSELVHERPERAVGWLANAERAGGSSERELAYWHGRAEESRGRLDQALDHYRRVLEAGPYHPLARAARGRLAGEPLARLAGREAVALASSGRASDLYSAWLLLGPDDPRAAPVRRALEAQLNADRGTAPFLELELEPVASWPLWQARLSQPEEMLLALGIWDEGAAVVLRHFPVTQPQLAFTGSALLAQAGEAHRSLYAAEVLDKRRPGRLPSELLPAGYRRLLYPFRYSYLILREASKRRVDPYLLAGIIREESRFDPDAFSAASARGLTQFVLPTARRFAAEAGLSELQPEHLERPEVAITLGAAYLERLSEDFGGATERMVAAYNAGEPQAALWRRYCASDEPEEFLTKVTFRETRGYLEKVLTSYGHYLELYAPKRSAPAPP